MPKTIEEIITLFKTQRDIPFEQFKKEFTLEDARVVDEWKKANPDQSDPISDYFSFAFGEKKIDPVNDKKCKEEEEYHKEEYRTFIQTKTNPDPIINDRLKSIEYMNIFGYDMELAASLDKFMIKYDKIVGNEANERRCNKPAAYRMQGETSYTNYLGDPNEPGYEERMQKMHDLIDEMNQDPNIPNAKMVPTNIGSSRNSAIPYEMKYNYNTETYLRTISMVRELYKSTGITFTEMAKNPDVLNEKNLNKFVEHEINNTVFGNKQTNSEKMYDFMFDEHTSSLNNYTALFTSHALRYNQFIASTSNNPYLASSILNGNSAIYGHLQNNKMPSSFDEKNITDFEIGYLRLKDQKNFAPLLTKNNPEKLKKCSIFETNKRINEITNLIKNDPKIDEKEKEERQLQLSQKVTMMYQKEINNRSFFDKVFHPFQTYALNKKFNESIDIINKIQEKRATKQTEIVKKPISVKDTTVTRNLEPKIEKEKTVQKEKTMEK